MIRGIVHTKYRLLSQFLSYFPKGEEGSKWQLSSEPRWRRSIRDELDCVLTFIGSTKLVFHVHAALLMAHKKHTRTHPKGRKRYVDNLNKPRKRRKPSQTQTQQHARTQQRERERKCSVAAILKPAVRDTFWFLFSFFFSPFVNPFIFDFLSLSLFLVVVLRKWRWSRGWMRLGGTGKRKRNMRLAWIVPFSR